MATQHVVDQPGADGWGRRRPTTSTPQSGTGAAWTGIVVALLVLTALIVFMLQNTQPVEVTFFALEATVPLMLALLIAAVGAGLVTLLLGRMRTGQLRRRRVRERRR